MERRFRRYGHKGRNPESREPARVAVEQLPGESDQAYVQRAFGALQLVKVESYWRRKQRPAAYQPVTVVPASRERHPHTDGGDGFCVTCQESMAWLGRP